MAKSNTNKAKAATAVAPPAKAPAAPAADPAVTVPQTPDPADPAADPNTATTVTAAAPNDPPANADGEGAGAEAANVVTGYAAAVPVKHNRTLYHPGEVIDGLDDDAAQPLLAIDAVIAIVDGKAE